MGTTVVSTCVVDSVRVVNVIVSVDVVSVDVVISGGTVFIGHDFRQSGFSESDIQSPILISQDCPGKHVLIIQ